MKPLKFLFLLAGVSALASLPPAVLAQSLSLVLMSYNTDYTVTLNTPGASPENVYATLQALGVSDQSPGLDLPASLNLFCVELGQFSPQNTPSPYNMLPAAASVSVQGGTDTRGSLDTLAGITSGGIGATRAGNLEMLYGYEFGGVYNPDSLTLYNRAVFQLAVWQLSHADGFTLSSGGPGFYLTDPSNPALLSDVQNLLTQVQTNAGAITPMALQVLHSENYQDFLVPIPEPSAYAALLGLAAFGFAALRPRKPVAGETCGGHLLTRVAPSC